MKKTVGAPAAPDRGASTVTELKDYVARHKRASTGKVVADLDYRTAPGKGKLPAAALHKWIASGITNNQQLVELCLADYGVVTTRQGISHWRKVNGYEVRVRSESAKALIPWKVSQEHIDDRRLRMLRTEARIREDQPVTPPDRRRHKAVLREMSEVLDDAVIFYDRVNGFHFVARRPGIDTDLISDPRIKNDGSPNNDPNTWQ